MYVLLRFFYTFINLQLVVKKKLFGIYKLFCIKINH